MPEFFPILALICFISSVHRSGSIVCNVTAKNIEGRLQQKLLCDYDKTIGPLNKSKNSPIVVRMRLEMQEYFYSQYASPRLIVNSWMRMSWIDENLKWNASEYNVIQPFAIPMDDIWYPQLTIWQSNSHNSQFQDSCKRSSCVVYNNGEVICTPLCSQEARCQADYRYWPFDKKNCSMAFGTQIQTSGTIDFQPWDAGISVDTLYLNTYWELIKYGVWQSPRIYPCCPDVIYKDLNYWFLVERHFAGEMAVVLAPTIILAVMNLTSTLLHPNGFERLLLITVSFLAHIRYIANIAEAAPKSGDAAPNIILYYRDSLVITAFLLLDTILMRGLLTCTFPRPTWIKSITSSLKSNRIGHLMFGSGYVIRRVTLNDNLPTDDVAELIEEENFNSISNQNRMNVMTWTTTVQLLDRIIFIIIFVSYIIMICSLVPGSYKEFIPDRP